MFSPFFLTFLSREIQYCGSIDAVLYLYIWT
jgi:hypothetical protein